MARSISRHRRSSFLATLLVFVAITPIALASQGEAKAKKKGGKKATPDASASSSASAAEETTQSAAPGPAPTPEPEKTAAASSEETTPPEAGTASASDDVTSSISYVREEPGKNYYFVGLRYRGTIVPSFLQHIFVDDGGTIYSNTIGAEFDFRKDAKSTIVSLSYTEYSMGNTLFFQKGKPDEENNYSIVSSSLKGIFAGVDELWSTPISGDHLSFEYGFGLGVGFIFGNLYNDWVYKTSASNPGAIKADNGNYYAPCSGVNNGTPLPGASYSSCDPRAHSNSEDIKVGNYVEKNWFQGGAVPVFFPRITGQVGLRYKPIKQLQTRLDVGIALTEGFWFGISADYGLEDTDKDHGHPASKPPAKETSPADQPAEDKTSRGDDQRVRL
jgi:hypothetical protein